MRLLNIQPGPDVGEALKFLLELKRREPTLEHQETAARLEDWWVARTTVTELNSESAGEK